VRSQSVLAQALDDAPPFVWPEYSAGLVQQAKTSQLGRRILAQALANGAAPALFGGLGHIKLLQTQRWMAFDRSAMEHWALDLGALLFAPVMRLIVLRKPLIELKTAIGEERYARALQADLSQFDDAWVRSAKQLLQDALNVSGALVHLLISEGTQELLNQVSERLRLQNPWLPRAGKPRLPRQLLSERLSALLTE
jgi:hypothetical protein